MEARSDPWCFPPSANSCQLRVNTLCKFHNWRLIIAETSGYSFLPALFLKMPSTIIPSILLSPWGCYHPSAICHRKQPPKMHSVARLPDLPGTFPSQAARSSRRLPTLWHLPLNHSSSFACCRPLSLPFSGSQNSFEKKLVQLSGVQFWCHSHLSKCHFDLPSFAPSYWAQSRCLPGKSCLPLCRELPVSCLLGFWISFSLYSFPSLLICELHYLLLHVTMPIAFPKECAFSSSNILGRMRARESDLFSDAKA